MTISEKLTTIAENQQKVYDAGYEKGKQSEYDRFWDYYQENGNRLNYVNAFAGTRWDNYTFKPKYDITTTSSVQGIFQNCRIGDLTACLESVGRKLDFSQCSVIDSAFAYSWVERVPEINVSRSGANCRTIFTNCTRLHTIDKLVVAETNTIHNALFNQCTALQNIVIEGIIATTIDLKWSPLSKDSILSVFNALSTTATGQTCTFKKTAVDAAFETSEGANDGSTSAEWGALKATKSNWTYALA